MTIFCWYTKLTHPKSVFRSSYIISLIFLLVFRIVCFVVLFLFLVLSYKNVLGVRTNFRGHYKQRKLSGDNAKPFRNHSEISSEPFRDVSAKTFASISACLTRLLHRNETFRHADASRINERHDEWHERHVEISSLALYVSLLCIRRLPRYMYIWYIYIYEYKNTDIPRNILYIYTYIFF